MIFVVLISMIAESDGDVVVGLFFLFFGIFFCVSSVVGHVISLISIISIPKYFKNNKRMKSKLIFTVISAAYILSLFLSVCAMRTLDFSLFKNR